MNHTVRTYGAALVIAMSCGCSDPPDFPPPNPTPDAGGKEYPLLPADCDDMTSVTSSVSGSSVQLAHFYHRIRAADRTVFYHRERDGLHNIEVPGGTSALLAPYPDVLDVGGAPKQLPMFRDFWISGTSILGAVGGALYDVASSSKAATLRTGYTAPSYVSAVEDRGYYARQDDTVFRTVRLATTGYAIERLPVASGPASVFLQLRGEHDGPIVAGGNVLYFIDRAEGDQGDAASIFATPLDAAAPTLVVGGLRDPGLLGMHDGALYFRDDSSTYGQLWRVRPDHAPEKLTMPGHAVLPIDADDLRFASFGGAAYVTAHALYRLPGDAGTSLRDIVLRLRSGSDASDVSQCLPDVPSNGASPDDFAVGNVDMTAGDSALYLSRFFLNTKAKSWDERITELRP